MPSEDPHRRLDGRFFHHRATELLGGNYALLSSKNATRLEASSASFVFSVGKHSWRRCGGAGGRCGGLVVLGKLRGAIKVDHDRMRCFQGLPQSSLCSSQPKTIDGLQPFVHVAEGHISQNRSKEEHSICRTFNLHQTAQTRRC